MEQNKIISDIEDLIEQLPYEKATLTIATKERIITIEKTKKEKKNIMGFSNGS